MCRRHADDLRSREIDKNIVRSGGRFPAVQYNPVFSKDARLLDLHRRSCIKVPHDPMIRRTLNGTHLSPLSVSARKVMRAGLPVRGSQSARTNAAQESAILSLWPVADPDRPPIVDLDECTIFHRRSATAGTVNARCASLRPQSQGGALDGPRWCGMRPLARDRRATRAAYCRSTR